MRKNVGQHWLLLETVVTLVTTGQLVLVLDVADFLLRLALEEVSDVSEDHEELRHGEEAVRGFRIVVDLNLGRTKLEIDAPQVGQRIESPPFELELILILGLVRP